MTKRNEKEPSDKAWERFKQFNEQRLEAPPNEDEKKDVLNPGREAADSENPAASDSGKNAADQN